MLAMLCVIQIAQRSWKADVAFSALASFYFGRLLDVREEVEG